MALSDIVSIEISLQTATVSRAGFGTTIFITNEQNFPERVRAYNSIDAVGEDFSTTDKAYIAANGAFSQIPPPDVVKIGKQFNTTATITPLNVVENTAYNITVTVNDGDSVTASYTALLADTEEDVANSIVADINADGDVAAHITASVVGVGAAAVIEIVPVAPATDTYALSSLQNFDVDYVSAETAATVLQAIRDVDDDFYFVTAHDHTQTFVTEMGLAVEAMDKIYFVAVQDTDVLQTLATPATDTLGILADNNLFRSSGWYHHQADERFPETIFTSILSTATPGTKVLGNNRVAGIGNSLNALGNPLTATEKSNLNDRFANWVTTEGGIDITIPGKVAANEWVDIIRDRDFYKARLCEGLQTKLINSPKIPYTNSGINEIRSVFNSVSDRLVTTPGAPNVLQEENPYTSNFPSRSDVPFADISNRILRASFIGYLAGAIQIVELEGVLTYDAML